MVARGLISALLAGLAFLAPGCALPGPAPGGPGIVAPTLPPQDLAPLGPGEDGLVLRCAKLLTMNAEDQIFDPGMIIVRNAKIEYVGPPIDPPAGFPERSFPKAWISPGMVDLHSHVQFAGMAARNYQGRWDTNDMVKPHNPELLVRPSVEPSNPLVRSACAAGVTTLFGIPGSGSSIGGFGVLWKTKTDATYEETVLRDPGGMKSAQNFNPQRGGGDLGRTWAGLAWQTEKLNDRVAAATRRGEDLGPAYEHLQRVHRGELPVLIHCASAEGVAGVVRMWKERWNTNCVISHGSWDGHLVGGYAAEKGVPVNHGPRTMNFTSMVREERVVGTAAEYVAHGVPNFSLNTDAPVMPQEEFFLQASMSARLGGDPYQMLRAVTSNPANSFLIGDRVGSLEVGKDADVVVSSGDPLDPRSRVELVLIDGQIQYSRTENGQWF